MTRRNLSGGLCLQQTINFCFAKKCPLHNCLCQWHKVLNGFNCWEATSPLHRGSQPFKSWPELKRNDYILGRSCPQIFCKSSTGRQPTDSRVEGKHVDGSQQEEEAQPHTECCTGHNQVNPSFWPPMWNRDQPDSYSSWAEPIISWQSMAHLDDLLAEGS